MASFPLSSFLFVLFVVQVAQGYVKCAVEPITFPSLVESQFRSKLRELNLTDRLFSSYAGPIGGSTLGAKAKTTPPTMQINVRFHVINQGPGYTYGDVNDSMIADQISALNTAFDGSGFVFNLTSVDRTTNSVWFNMGQGSSQESQAKQALHLGGGTDLNIYTCKPTNQVIGWGTYPWDYSNAAFADGIVVLYSTLPGGTAAPYNLGHTAVHEIGHWLGLYHTFQGGCCDGTSCGDYVSDTPAEASGASGCPSSRDTCTSLSGADPIGDYMDYTDDTCTYYFTYGQANRMTQAWNAYRVGK